MGVLTRAATFGSDDEIWFARDYLRSLLRKTVGNDEV